MAPRGLPELSRFFAPEPFGQARSLVAAGLRPAVHFAQEHHARAALTRRSRGRGPMAVFLPNGPATGAALLRIYNMVDALRPLGWRTAVLPWRLGLAARRRVLAAVAPDVLVMQGARHSLNRPALYPDWPVVFDMDDADFHLPHLAHPVREAVASAAHVTAGSRYIADWCLAQGAAAAEVVWTGTPVTGRTWPRQDTRPPVVAWAQSRPMDYRAEAALVARVMAGVAAARPGTRLRLYDRRPGDDLAFQDQFAAPGLHIEWEAACSYEAYLTRFGDVAVGLAPLCPKTPFSRGKSFGKVLGYLDARVPAVVSDTGEPRAFFTPETGAVVGSDAAWVAAIVTLLDDADLRQRRVDAAYDAFCRHLSVEASAAGLDRVLRRVVGPERATKTGFAA